MLNFFSSRDIALFNDVFNFFFKKNLSEHEILKPILKKLTELESLKLIVGGGNLGTLRGCKSGVQLWLLSSFWFSRFGDFMIF